MLSLEKLLEDGKLHIFLLGSGGPINNNIRVTSSIAIIAGGEFVLFDAGPGTYRNADLLRLPVAHLNAIFITHFHSDHIGDIGEANMMSWVSGRTNPLEIYGPPGIENVVNGFKLAYDFDTRYRLAHHGTEILPPEAAIPISRTINLQGDSEKRLCFNKKDLKVFAFEVDHSPVYPAFGYRIEYKGNIVVISGDTKKIENLVKHSRNADILFCEAISFDALNNIKAAAQKLNQSRFIKILTDIQNYHMNPASAARIAKEANVKKLVLVHITPSLPRVEKLYLNAINETFNGDIIISEDRMEFTLDCK